MDYAKLMETLSLKENSSQTASFYKSFCVELNDIETEIVYADHSDKTLIFATQYNKIGALLMVTKDQAENIDCRAEPVFTVKPIFGTEDPDQLAAARFIAEKIQIDKPLFLFLSLKSYQVELVKTLVEILIAAKDK